MQLYCHCNIDAIIMSINYGPLKSYEEVVTKCVGDNFEMLVTVLAVFVTNISEF